MNRLTLTPPREAEIRETAKYEHGTYSDDRARSMRLMLRELLVEIDALRVRVPKG